jgi:hypothetical protein
VLKNSGEPLAVEHAINCFEEALKHSDDRRAAHSLASLYYRKGSYRKVIDLKFLLWDKADAETKHASFDLLLEALSNLGEKLAAEQLKVEHEKLPPRKLKQMISGSGRSRKGSRS